MDLRICNLIFIYEVKEKNNIKFRVSQTINSKQKKSVIDAKSNFQAENNTFKLTKWNLNEIKV